MKIPPSALQALARCYAGAVVDDLFKPHWVFTAKKVKRPGKRKPFYILDFAKESAA